MTCRPTLGRIDCNRVVTVPGCSRPAANVHHVRYRSHGGGNDEANLTAVCLAHHLHGVHKGYVRVRGRAPDELVWELGES